MFTKELVDSPLGKKTIYCRDYNPELLFPMERKGARDEIGIGDTLPFHGIDIWNAYEASWLDAKGKPVVAVIQFYIPAESPYIIESKSLKLYFNSFSQTKFASPEAVKKTIERDLSGNAKFPVEVKIFLPQDLQGAPLEEFKGKCIDYLDIDVEEYTVNPKLLKTSSTACVEEELHSNLLKSNCLITNQPDWASVYIHYIGPKINPISLLKYIISFRNHNEFHEPCIERIFIDLMRECRLEKLTVYGKYTRRGGLDINPFRSNFESCPTSFERTTRQ